MATISRPLGTTMMFTPLLLFPSTSGEKTYLNVTDGTEPKGKLVEEKGWTAETVSAYLIYSYRVTADVLMVQGINGDQPASQSG